VFVRFFYRNRVGKDTKLISWSNDFTKEAENGFQLYADINVVNSDYQHANSNGVFLHKVVGGALVLRDIADLAKDKANVAGIIQQASDAVDQYLDGKEKATWLMFGASKTFEYLQAVQAAAGIADNQLSVQGQTAKATLEGIRVGLTSPIEVIIIQRDADIALLDQED